MKKYLFDTHIHTKEASSCSREWAADIVKRYKELGYDGYVTIEREIWNEQQQPDIIHARDYLTEIINEVYGG